MAAAHLAKSRKSAESPFNPQQSFRLHAVFQLKVVSKGHCVTQLQLVDTAAD